MSATPLKLISSMATREVLAALAGECERALAQPLLNTVGGGVEVAKRVQAGEPVDIVVLNANAIDTLIGAGSLLPGSRVDLVKSGVAIAVQAGAPHPDVGSEAAVRAAVLAARAPGWSTGPSGVYLEKLFERWGILSRIRERVVVATPGVPVASLVAQGQCDLGFQQSSEMRNVAGIDVVGPLPPSIQIDTVFSGGVSVHSRHASAARAVLRFMASPAQADVKRRLGMQPA
jgi:molybdate transport system substrate-binding protein